MTGTLLICENSIQRCLLVYDPADPDVPMQRIVLAHDEADELAELLHSRPVADRLAALERRVAELVGESA